MKLENDPGFRLPSPPRKSYNPFDSDDDSPRTVPAENLVKGSNVFNLKDYESTPDSLAADVNNIDFPWEEAILGHPKVDDRAVNAHVEIFEKESELYTDKTIPECELPEFIVCYKESSFESVKDIVIDEGVPSPDKMRVKGREDMDLPTFMDLDGGSSPRGSDAVKEDKDLRIQEGLQSRAPDQTIADDSVKMYESLHGTPDGPFASHLPETDEAVKLDVMKHDSEAEAKSLSLLDSSVNGVETKENDMVSGVRDGDFPEKISEVDADEHRDSELMHNHQAIHEATEQEEETPAPEEVSEVTTSTSVQVLDPEGKDVMLPPQTSEDGEIEALSSQNPSPEATLPQPPQASQLPQTSQPPPAPSTGEGDDSASSSNTKPLSYDSKIESGSITFDFNSSEDPLAPPGSAQEDKKSENVAAVETAPQRQSMSRNGGEGPSGPASIVNTFEDRVHGETSFSASAHPASITHLGPISYSGSLSLRSESSHGSTRSFAFPVLQTEWNSSPVRMAKADQRHFKKHRGWVQNLICCRF